MNKMFVVFVFCLVVGVQSKFCGDVCKIDDQVGKCTPLSQCDSIQAEVISAGLPMPKHMRNKLDRLACGFTRNEPMICCSSSVDSNTIPGDQTPRPDKRVNPDTSSPNIDPLDPTVVKPDWDERDDNETEGLPDVSEHPNLALLPKDCGNTESNRIYGGNRTALFEMPWMVLLSYNEGRDSKLGCGGTLINEWYVLTAAHCVEYLGNNLRLEGVILGEYDVRTDPDCEKMDDVRSCAPKKRDVPVDEVIVHTGYRPQTLLDDIALIRLLEPADFSLDSMKAICLPYTRDLQVENLEGQIGTVAGWGVTEIGLQSPVLLAVDLPIVKKRDCQAAYRGVPKLRETQLCAGGVKDKDSCGGDSGGPLIYPGNVESLGVRFVQRGIVSFGSKRCGIGGYPGVYTNVAYYMDWILDNMKSAPLRFK